MEKVCFLIYSALLVLTRAIYVKSDAAPVKKFSGSSYIFYRSNGNRYNWERSKTICEQSGYNLVSIESREEWNFLKQTIQKENTTEYFIGLRKDPTGVWRWLSDNSTVNVSNKGDWPWATGQPSDEHLTENCAQIYGNYKYAGRYNDVLCSLSKAKAGFICEFKGGGEKKSAKATASTITGRLLRSPTTSAGTKAVTTQGKTSSEHKSSALSALLTVQTSPTTTFPVVTKVDDLKKDTNCFSLYLANAILAALLFIVMIILAVVLILLRASRNKAVKTSQRDFQESLALNTLNVDARPEFASRNGTGIERLHSEPLVQQEGVYIALSPESMMTSENDGSRMYTSLVK